jgi:hypothetical protein
MKIEKVNPIELHIEYYNMIVFLCSYEGQTNTRRLIFHILLEMNQLLCLMSRKAIITFDEDYHLSLKHLFVQTSL